MSCQEIIPLEGLNEDESWDLFQKRAGLFDNPSNNLKDMAQKITKVCDGLPIAIETIANTLKNKPHHQWVEVLNILRKNQLYVKRSKYFFGHSLGSNKWKTWDILFQKEWQLIQKKWRHEMVAYSIYIERTERLLGTHKIL